MSRVWPVNALFHTWYTSLFILVNSRLKISLEKKSRPIQAESSDFILNPVRLKKVAKKASSWTASTTLHYCSTLVADQESKRACLCEKLKFWNGKSDLNSTFYSGNWWQKLGSSPVLAIEVHCTIESNYKGCLCTLAFMSGAEQSMYFYSYTFTAKTTVSVKTFCGNEEFINISTEH